MKFPWATRLNEFGLTRMRMRSEAEFGSYFLCGKRMNENSQGIPDAPHPGMSQTAPDVDQTIGKGSSKGRSKWETGGGVRL